MTTRDRSTLLAKGSTHRPLFFQIVSARLTLGTPLPSSTLSLSPSAQHDDLKVRGTTTAVPPATSARAEEDDSATSHAVSSVSVAPDASDSSIHAPPQRTDQHS